jgi:hypothetical protein
MAVIIPIATFALMLRYIIDTDAAKRAKYIIGGTAGASFFIPAYLPYGFYVALAIQLGISIFILLYLKAMLDK